MTESKKRLICDSCGWDVTDMGEGCGTHMCVGDRTPTWRPKPRTILNKSKEWFQRKFEEAGDADISAGGPESRDFSEETFKALRELPKVPDSSDEDERNLPDAPPPTS